MKRLMRFSRIRTRERGAILFIVAASLFVLIGFLGLAFDLGHLYNNKSQLQNMADACALSGATALNSTSAGIQLATDRARDSLGRLNNKTEFNNLSVSLAEPDISFSTQLNGTYVDKATAQGIATTIRYVRVVIPPQQSEIFFAKLIPGIPAAFNLGAEAVAGQNPVTQVCAGLDPFSPAIRNGITDPTQNFGYTPGLIYEIRLSPGSSGHTCGEAGITGSQTGNFGMADPAGCGNNVPCLRETIRNGSKANCVGMGNDLPNMCGGYGLNPLRELQDRFDLDLDTTTYVDYNGYLTYAAHLAATPPTANGKRLIRVAFNDANFPSGCSTNYTVVGFGCFFMASRPYAAPPSSAICLMYVGSCGLNGSPSGTGGGASLTQLVLFR